MSPWTWCSALRNFWSAALSVPDRLSAWFVADRSSQPIVKDQHGRVVVTGTAHHPQTLTLEFQTSYCLSLAGSSALDPWPGRRYSPSLPRAFGACGIHELRNRITLRGLSHSWDPLCVNIPPNQDPCLPHLVHATAMALVSHNRGRPRPASQSGLGQAKPKHRTTRIDEKQSRAALADGDACHFHVCSCAGKLPCSRKCIVSLALVENPLLRRDMLIVDPAANQNLRCVAHRRLLWQLARGSGLRRWLHIVSLVLARARRCAPDPPRHLLHRFRATVIL